ncbi:toxin-antitoxin system YwqK family antitoxin [Neisseria sp. SLRRB23]|uniref:toxin-antitoxin system YwqK family antitoxin n=1 Tax=Neisseria sp. SLRRB23 TaxID=3435199 RepID=UPI003D7FD525
MKHAPIILLLAGLSAALLSAGCTALPSDRPPLHTLPKSAPIQPTNPYSRPPSGTSDGAYSIRASNGRVLKSIVKNGVFDRFVDIYHPNGKLHSHTPVENGVAQGWSQGYTEQGILRTRILYRDGHIIRAQTLDASGKVEREWQP